MAININKNVHVEGTIAVDGAKAKALGVGLFITSNDFLDSQAKRTRMFADFDALSKVFPETTEAYKAGNTWFMQSPYPKSLVIGNWRKEAFPAKVVGATLTKTLAELKAKGEVSVHVLVDGDHKHATMDLTNVASLSDLAASVQTALSSKGVDILTSYDATNNRFVAQTSQTGAQKSLGFTITNNLADPAILVGGTVALDVTTIEAYKANSSFKITINNTEHEVSPDFENVNNEDEIIEALQAAIDTAFGSNIAIITYANSKFTIETVALGAGATIAAATEGAKTNKLDALFKLKAGDATATNGKTYPNVNSDLGLAQGEVNPGLNAETLTDALNAIRNHNEEWYFVMLDHTMQTRQILDMLATFVQTSDYMASIYDDDANMRTSGDTSSLAYTLHNYQYNRTFMTSSDTDKSEYKDVSAAARLSSVDHEVPNSLITMKYKRLPGMTPDNLGNEEAVNLDKLRVNYYTTYMGQPIYAEGVTFADNTYIDMQYGFDWFSHAMRTAVFNLLYGANKIPQTPAGDNALVHVMTQVCERAVANGLIAPGYVTEQMQLDIKQTFKGNKSTAMDEFDGYLPLGYLIFSGSNALQPQELRAARMATSKKIWLKAAGAVHSIKIAFTIEN